MKWFKVLAAEMYSKEEEELLDKFGTTGYFIKHRLINLMALRLNPLREDWMNFEFTLIKFKQVFNYGWRGSLFKVLDHLMEKGEIFYRITGNKKKIEIYSRQFEKMAQIYVNRAKRKAETDEREGKIKNEY